VGARLARWEQNARALTLIKLTNVGLTMLWGFAVTYVFVRLLPERDFRALLLLIAFNNFTVSAEFGLTNIIYARLRKFWLGGRAAEAGFRLEELGALFVGLLALILLATVAVVAALAMGMIPTQLPLLFLLFFLASALNVQILLAKRGLAAIDRNLLWEGLDLTRRVLTLLALVATLAGMNLLFSVAIQLALSLIAIGLAILILHRALGMKLRQWFAWRIGGGHMRRTYLGDVGASILLTMSEVAAYNAPYFIIAALTRETRILLLFDFAFKMGRALSTAVRATIEAILPGATRAFYSRDKAAFNAILRKATIMATAIAACASGLLLVAGPWLFEELYHGKAQVGIVETSMICIALLALSLICVSVYVQGALGRFTELLGRSIPFLLGSLALMPMTLVISRVTGGQDDVFMLLYALLFAGVAVLHTFSLRRLGRGIGQ